MLNLHNLISNMKSKHFQDIFSMFKSYDLRGRVPILNSSVYYLMGIALVKCILEPEKRETVVNVACDARNSSVEFYNSFCSGVESAGGTVYSIGLGPTELMYCGCLLNGNSGAMITASHNPKGDNGCKMVKVIPEMIGLGSGLELIRDFVIKELENGFDIENVAISEFPEDTELKEKCINLLIEKINLIGNLQETNQLFSEKNKEKKYKIVVDTANGMGGYVMPIIQKLYPEIEFIPLYWELDGNFPNHPADPIVPENLIDLQKIVKSESANLGIAFDGDADRVFFIDENGKTINMESLIALFSKTFLESNFDNSAFNPAIVYVSSYSRATPETVTAMGGAAIPSIQGHTNVKKSMKKYNAIYGGEASGHHYFGQFGFMDSGALVIGLMLKIISKTDQKASQLLNFWNKTYFTSGEENYEIDPGLKMQNICESIEKAFPGGIYNTKDGISVFFPSYKFTIRMSNTSATKPIVRINVETKFTDFAIDKMNEIKKLLNLN